MIFLIAGYSSFNIYNFIEAIIPTRTISYNFTGCYLFFFLLIPFLNILVSHINQKQHQTLLIICLFVYVFFGTIPHFSISMNYTSWFIILFFVGSYVRLYPKKIYYNNRLWGTISLLFIFICCFSVVICKYMNFSPYRFVSDSNTFLAFITAFCLFMFFNSLDIEYNLFINKISSATFGVLCIHANSDLMRQWLWKDVLNNAAVYNTEYSIIHAISSVFIIYIICTIIELIRQRFIEKYIMDVFHKIEEKIHINSYFE